MVVRQTEWLHADVNSLFPTIRTLDGGRTTFEVGGGVRLDTGGGLASSTSPAQTGLASTPSRGWRPDGVCFTPTGGPTHDPEDARPLQ
jgi:hypothetical protein